MVVADHYNTPRAEWLVMAVIALKKVPWFQKGGYMYPDKHGNVVVPMWNGHAPIRLGNLAGEVSIDSGY